MVTASASPTRRPYSSRTLDHEKVWRATASMRPTRAPTGIAPINEPKHVKPSATKSTYATADARPVPPAEMLTSDWPSSPQPPIPPQSPEIRFPRPKARHSCDAWPRPYAFPRVRPSTSWSVRSDWSSPTAANSPAAATAARAAVAVGRSSAGNAARRLSRPPANASAPTTSRSRGAGGIKKVARPSVAAMARSGAGTSLLTRRGVPSIIANESAARPVCQPSAAP
mmetsp:Transcript_22400/g.69194  ORF Transcript_22400/g.69194 Transcript_22400/m.69194 type:complete len:226 (-) Transcript_22400:588-1265(-)